MKTAIAPKFLQFILLPLFVFVLNVGWGQVSISSAGTAFTQNFDGMNSTGTTTPTNWVVGSATAAASTTVVAGTGSANSGGNYNFGIAGTNTVGDRALGSLCSSSTARNTQVSFINNTGSGISSITISYDGEQWRLGQNSSSETGLVLYFSTNGTSFTAMGTSYNFVPPVTTGTAGPLDGNASANRISNRGGVYTPSAPIASGSIFYLRWVDSDNSGSDAANAIDNFSITATAVASTPSINGSATATSFTTTYGTASTAQTFAVSGSNLTADLVATAPTGFEVSSDGTTYGSTASFTQTSGSASGTLSVRLKADAPVTGTSYNGVNIQLTSTGATTVNITTATSGNTVSAKALTITGLSAANKNYDGNTTVFVSGTAAYSGLVNSESFPTVSTSGTVSWVFPSSSVGNYTLTQTNTYTAPSSNYTVTQPSLTASINAIVPTAPTITVITAGSAQLSVAFTAPSSNGGASITNYEYSINNGSSFTAFSPAQTSTPLVISGLTNGTTYDVQIRAVNSTGFGTASNMIQGTPVAPASPTITVTPALFTSSFSATYGTPSAVQTFSVAAAAIDQDVLVTAPTGFEISLTNSTGFASSLTLAQSAGEVASTTIYARLLATAAAGSNYNSSVFTISVEGAADATITTSSTGNAVAQKALTITGLSVANKSYDGNTNATVSGTAVYSELANSETFAVVGSATATFASANVGNGIAVTVTGFSAPSTNYTLTQPSFTANITAVNLTISGIAISNKVYNGTTAATITGTAAYQGLVNGQTFSITGTPSAVFTSATVGTSIAVTVSGYTAPSANYTLTQPTGLTADITQANQSITFNALANKTTADVPFALTATASSGLSISYTSSNTAVATISGSTVTIVGVGSTTITASQVGNENYNAASDISQILIVSPSLLIEDFNYPNSAALTSNNWTEHSGSGVNPISTATGSITFSGYLSSGIGNEISLATSGQDINRPISTVNSGSLYASFIVNVSAATTIGDYFAHFAASSGSSGVTSFGGRIWVRRDASGNLAFGISKSSTSTNINYTVFNYSMNTTYLIVVKYNFIVGNSNDTADLFVNPSLNSLAPTPNISTSTADNASVDPIELKSFCLRQGSSSTAPQLKLDGIRVSLFWGDVVGRANPTLSIANPTQTYSSSPISATVTGSVAGTISNVKYNGSATVPTAAGTYAVTADFVPTDGNNYNSITNSNAGDFVITNAALTITATNQSKCAGATLTLGSILFSSSGLVGSDAVSSVTLTSSGSDAGAAAGSYSIVPSDASGSGLSNYNITYTNGSLTVNALPIAPTAGSTSRCGEGAVTLTASANTGETTDWYAASSGGSALAQTTGTFTTPTLTSAATYYVEARNTTTGCVSAIRTGVIVTIITPEIPSVSIASSDVNNSICPNETVTFTATATNGGTAPTYQWKLNGSNVDGTGSTYETSSLSNSDVITVVMTANNSCQSPNSATSNAITTAVNTTPAALSLTGSSYCAYTNAIPNTTYGSITSSNSVSGISYTLFNVNGDEVLTYAGTGSALSWTGVVAATGYYVTGVNTTTGCVGSSAVVAVVMTTATISLYVDTDGDGYGTGSAVSYTCVAVAPAGYSLNANDCSTSNSAFNPGAVEICGNNIDENCSGASDDAPIAYRSIADGNWGDASMWEMTCNAGSAYVSATYAPVSYFTGITSIQNAHDIIIPADGVTYQTGTLEILSGGSLTLTGNGFINIPTSGTVSPIAKLTVTQSINNAGTLTIGHQASLAQLSTTAANTGSGIVNVETKLTGSNNGTAPNGRYWYIGSPMNNTVASQFFDTPSMVRLWSYNGSSISWSVVVHSTSNPTVTTTKKLVPGIGYLYRAGSEKIITYEGTPSTLNNNIVSNLLAPASDVNYVSVSGYQSTGYKFVANPYPSYIDWKLVTRSGLNVSYWIRNANNSAYDAYNATTSVSSGSSGQTTQFIPPMQGFYVYAFNSTPSLRIDNTDRVHSSNVLHAPTVNQVVRLKLNNGASSDYTVVYENEVAANDYEEADTDKMFDYDFHQLYTLEGEHELALNGLSNATAKGSVDMGISVANSGQYTIEATDLEVEEDVILEDKFNHTFQDMKVNSIYSFTSQVGTFNERFVLHFTAIETETVGVTEREIEGVRVYKIGPQQVKVCVMNTAEYQGANVKVYDAIGNLIERKNMTSNELVLDLDIANGIYVVEVTGTNKTFTKKVFITK